jgi:hypothetical protein
VVAEHVLGRRRRTDAVVGALTVVAGLAYSLFLLTPVLGATLDPATSFVSELAAIDQPTSAVFRVVDGVVGLVLVLVGIHLATRTRRLSPRWAGAALALFGMATLLDAVLPMTCAPSAEPVCAAAEAGRSVTSFGLHEVTSVSANLAAIVAIFLLAAARFRRRPEGGPSTPAGRVFLGALTVVVATGIVVVLNDTVGSGLEPVVGYVQRVQVLALSVVIVTIGLVTLGRARGTR